MIPSMKGPRSTTPPDATQKRPEKPRQSLWMRMKVSWFVRFDDVIKGISACCARAA